MATQYSYHETTKKLVTAFGALFNEIDIRRVNTDGATIKTIRVPISFAPKHRFIARIQEDYNNAQATTTQVTLPRLSFSFDAPVFDEERMLSKLNKIGREDTLGNIRKLMSPIPYNYPFTLSLWSKNLDDALQVAEQIMATFAPEVNIRITDIAEIDLCTDVPFILEGISYNDDYEGDFSDFRMIEWEFQFNVKGYVYPILDMSGDGEVVIKKINLFIKDLDSGLNWESITNTVNPITAFPPDEYTIDEVITEL